MATSKVERVVAPRRNLLMAAPWMVMFPLVAVAGLWVFQDRKLSPSCDEVEEQLWNLECKCSAEAPFGRRCSAVLSRVGARRRIVRDLLAGQLTLLQAAERFRDLNEAAADFPWESFRNRFQGSSDDERICRQVIMAVESEFLHQPAEGQVHGKRLEIELQKHLQGGRLCLGR